MSSIIYLENRSAAETDDVCGMKYWWSQEEGGSGIVHKTEAEALTVGREIHEDMEALATMENLSVFHLEELCESLLNMTPVAVKEDIRAKERLYRRLGWIAAWGLYIEPKIRERWETILVEGELILDRDPLWVAVTPDRVLRHKKDGFLKYMEFKSTITANQKWISSWKYAIQLHLGMKAIEEEFDRKKQPLKISFAEVVGLMKGDVKNGHLLHPYVWAYHNTRTGAWSCKYERASEWVPLPVWEYPHGIVKWVEFCGEETAIQQFPTTAPVTINERMVEQWCSRRLSRQVEVAEVREECQKNYDARIIYFEPRTRNCRPPFGDLCPYLGLCWNASMQLDPMKTGDYKKRVPHHELEVLLEGE